jgi:hypothetical protein
MPLAARALRAKATTPAAPGTPTATSYQNGQIPVSWTAPAFTGGAPLTDYVLQYSSNGGANWTTWSHSPGWTTSATVTGLSNGTSYVFRVFGVNAVGQGTGSSNSASAVPATTPAAPGTPTISVTTAGRIDVTWSTPASNGGAALTDYTLQWSSNGGASWNTWSHGAVWTTAANVTGLTDYQTYVVRVAAVNIVGQGSYSTTSASAVLRNAATGGSTTDVGNYNGTGQTWRLHTFEAAGSWTFTASQSPHTYRVFVLGAGGDGGNGGNPGQGGSVARNSSFAIPAGAYTVTVGNRPGGTSSIGALVSASGGASQTGGAGGGFSDDVTGQSRGYAGNGGKIWWNYCCPATGDNAGPGGGHWEGSGSATYYGAGGGGQQHTAPPNSQPGYRGLVIIGYRIA